MSHTNDPEFWEGMWERNNAGMNPMNLWGMKQEVMDVTGSLRKISQELTDLRRDDEDLELKLEGASWLLTYIADCLDVELQHAAARGRKQAEEQGTLPPGPNGVKNYSVISGDDI